jgi:hypothetical protein
MGKIAVIGGGAGLMIFLYNRQKAGGGSTSDSSFGLPNTAIMLGSLQQGQLDLKGQVGSGVNDLSNQMASDTSQIQDNITGSTETLGQTLSMMSTSLNSSFSNLQGNLLDSQTANTNTILNSIGASTASIQSDLNARGDLLSQLISGNQSAMQAAMKSIADSMNSNQNAIITQQNAESAALGALGANVSSSQSAIISQLNQLQSQDLRIGNILTLNQSNYITQRVNQLVASGFGSTQALQTAQSEWSQGYAQSGNLAYGTPASSTFDWSALNGKVLFSNSDNSYYTVQNSQVFKTSSAWAQQNSGATGQVQTSLSLKALSQGTLG